MATSVFIAAGSQQLHCRRSGTGKRLLLAFHGYGNDASIFSSFDRHLAAGYTILSFDLPHHGKSTWMGDTVLSKKDLVHLLEEVRKNYNTDKFSLLGYSMGGRVCLSAIELMPQCVDKVVLIAADGLTFNYLYYFATRTLLGKTLFAHLLSKPERYFRILDWMRDKKYVDASRHRFAMQYLQSESTRKFLLQVWPAMSALMPNEKTLKKVINQYRIPVAIFMGAYDKIIPPALAHRFKTGMDTVQVHILQKGHRVFDHENTADIAAYLL